MRLREFLEIQKRTNIRLNEWTKSDTIVTDTGEVIRPSKITPDNIPSGSKPYQIYDYWQASKFKDAWDEWAFKEEVVPKYFPKQMYSPFYNTYAIIPDVDEIHTISGAIQTYLNFMEHIIRKHNDKVFYYSSNDGGGYIYLFYHPIKKQVVGINLHEYGDEDELIVDFTMADMQEWIKFTIEKYGDDIKEEREPGTITIRQLESILEKRF